MSPRLTDLFLNSQSDERLVSLAHAGHERAFAAIVLRYRRSLHALAHRLVSDGTAEDVVQQTFLNAYAALQSGAEVQHLSGWLHRILRNTALRAGGHVRAETQLETVVVGSEPLEESVQRRQQARDLFAELAALPDRQRDALVATALHGHSRETVAASAGISEGAVRQLVHRARATLRTAVTALTPWPVANWLASAPDAVPADQLGMAASAGGFSLAGAGLKAGALMASVAVATGVGGSAHRSPAGHRSHPAAMHVQTRSAAPSSAAATAAARLREESESESVGDRHGSGDHGGSRGGDGGSRGGDGSSRGGDGGSHGGDGGSRGGDGGSRGGDGGSRGGDSPSSGSSSGGGPGPSSGSSSGGGPGPSTGGGGDSGGGSGDH